MENNASPNTGYAKKIFLASDYIIKILFLGLCLLTPLFFLPISFDFFDFNKTALFYSFASLSFVLYAVKMVASKTLYLKRSFLDLPLLCLLITFSVSSFFSENKYYSLIGTQGSFEYSLVFTLVSYLYFYTITSNLKRADLEFGLMSVLAGGAIASLLFIPYVLGFKLINNYWTSDFFNTIGSVSALGAYLAICFVLGIGLIIESEKTLVKGVISAGVSIIALGVVLQLNLILFFTMAIGSGLMLILAKDDMVKESLPHLSSVALTTIISLLIVITPSIRTSLGIKYPLPRDINPSVQVSWSVASTIIGNKPFFGAGLNSFYSNYSRYRPVYTNSLDTWNFRFARPSSEYINILATAGVMGLLATVFLVFRVIKKSVGVEQKASILEYKGTKESTGFAISSKVVLISLFVLLALRPTSLTLSIVFLIILSTFSALADSSKFIKKETPEVPPAVLVVISLLCGTLWYFSYRAYSADYYFRLGINDLSQGGRNTYRLTQMAVAQNPLSDLYRSNYAQANLALANVLSQKQNLTDSEKSDVQALVSQAIREVRVLTEVISPLNPDSWEIRADIYKSLNAVAEDAKSWSISAYNNAIMLDPYNPRLRVNLGGMYFMSKDYQNALASFASAVNLKNDYANAHYNLAQAYKELKDLNNTAIELEIVQRLIPQDSEDYKRVEEELKPIREALEKAKSTTQKPSVEQLEAKGTKPAQVQEPLRNPAEQQNSIPAGNDITTVPPVENP